MFLSPLRRNVLQTRDVLQRGNVLQTRRPLTRLASSSATPRNPTPERTTAALDPSIPPRRSPRPPKVELRPAPLKPPLRQPQSKVITSIPIPRPLAPSHEPFDHLLRRQDILDDFALHDIASAPPGLSKIQQLWHTFKEYAKFYIRGIRMIWKHREHAARIRARIASGEAAVPLSRWESRFLQTHKADMRKLAPFLLLLVVLEEIIPFIVIYAPSILPSTCVLPSQLAKIQTKRDEKQVKWLHAAAGDPSLRLRMQETMSIRAIDLTTLSGDSVQILCGILRLSTTGPSPLLRSRLTKHLHMLSSDDALLSRESMGSWLDARGVSEALSERGIAPQGVPPIQRYARLRRYLEDVNGGAGKGEVDPAARRVFVVLEGALGERVRI